MYYKGCDMALAHEGMGITETDWKRFMGIVIIVTGDPGVGQAEGSEVMTFFGWPQIGHCSRIGQQVSFPPNR